MNSGNQIKGQALYNQQQLNKNLNGPTIICDGLQSPENLGSILRVADAAGSQKIILLDSGLDLNNKKLSKLARSTDRHLTVEHATLEKFITNRHQFNALYALEITDKSIDIFQSDITTCDGLVLGHEAGGVREDLLSLCDMAIHLPMYGVNGSMNISHALAVCLFEWRRQVGVQ